MRNDAAEGIICIEAVSYLGTVMSMLHRRSVWQGTRDIVEHGICGDGYAAVDAVV